MTNLQAKSKLKRLRMPMYIIICIAYMFVTFHRLTPSVMGATLRADMGLNASSFAWIGTVYMWVYAICQAPVGTMLDKIGTRKGVSVLLFLTAVGGITFAIAQNLTMLLIGRGLVALSVSGFMVGGAKVCSKWFTTKEYTTFYPIFMSLGALGGVLATTPLQLMMNAWGWRTAIIGISSFSALLFILSAILMRDDPSKVGLASADDIMYNNAAELTAASEAAIAAENKAAAEKKAAKPAEKVSLGTVLAMPILWICGFVALGPNSSGQCLQSLWEGVYLTDVYGYSATTISNILLCSSIGLVLGSLVATPLMKKIKLSRTLILSSSLFMVAWLYMTLKCDNLSVIELCIVNFVLGTCQMCTITTNFTVIREVMPTDRLGTAMGCLNTFIWIFGAGLFQKVWGWIIDAISGGVKPYPANAFSTCMWVQTAVIALTVIATLIIFSMSKKGKLKARNNNLV